MSLVSNNNIRSCLHLVLREYRFYKIKNLLLALAVLSLTLLYTVVLYMGDVIQNAYLKSYQIAYGSSYHITVTGINELQAQMIKYHPYVKNSAYVEIVGLVTDEALEYRNLQLAIVDQQYANTTGTTPTVGNMPTKPNEIALDTLTLDELNLPYEIGTRVELELTEGASVQKGIFTLSGYWYGTNNFTESYAWITTAYKDNLAEKAYPLTLGLTLHRPADLQKQAQEITSELNIGEVDFTVNLAYNSARIQKANSKALPYYVCILFVLACGFLMIINIFQGSSPERNQLMIQIKSLGMTPRQICWFISLHTLILGLVAIPLGLVLGLGIVYLIAPTLVFTLTNIQLDTGIIETWPLLLSALLSLSTALAAAFAASRRFIFRTPTEIRILISPRRILKRSDKEQKVTLLYLALTSIKMQKASLLVTAVSLFVAVLLLCSTYIRYISYDMVYYLTGTKTSDYRLLDRSSNEDFMRYNEKAGNIRFEIVEQLRQHPAVKELAYLLSKETRQYADAELQGIITDFYNGMVSATRQVSRKSTMEYHPDWMSGYETFEKTGEYSSILYGTEGIALEYFLNQGVLSGEFDAEKFATGEYVIALGAASSTWISGAPAGHIVSISGRKYSVMMTVQSTGLYPFGLDSKQSAFSLNYILPSKVLLELFPETNIRQVEINVFPDKKDSFEQALKTYTSESGISVKYADDKKNSFQDSIFVAVSVQFLIGLLLLMISLLNFTHVLITKMLMAKKDYAFFQSLGMGFHQIRKMLLYEGLIQAGALLLAVVPLATLLLRIGMPYYYDSDYAYTNKFDWAVTYQFSMLPIWFIAFLILTLSIVVTQIHLNSIKKKSVAEQLRNTTS